MTLPEQTGRSRRRPTLGWWSLVLLAFVTTVLVAWGAFGPIRYGIVKLPSTPMKVNVATIRVGRSVNTPHSRTSRMCRREPAAPRRRSSQICVIRPPSNATNAMAMTRSATSRPVIQPRVPK